METSGTTVVILKEFLQEHGEETERQVLQQLSARSRVIFNNVSINSWIPMQADTEIKQAGAAVLFPNQPNGVVQLNRLIAQKTLNETFGVSRRYLSLKTLAFSAEKLWSDLWHKGNISIEKLTDRSMTIVVRDFPELLEEQLDMIRGYITGILDLTGARNIKSKTLSTNPSAWEWRFTWK